MAGYCLLLYTTVKERKLNKHLFIQVTYTSPNTVLTTVLTMEPLPQDIQAFIKSAQNSKTSEMLINKKCVTKFSLFLKSNFVLFC